MKTIILSAIAAVSLTAAVSCSHKPEYNRETVVTLLEKQSGWTPEEYAAMFDQLQATQEKLQEGDLTDAENEFLLVSNSDMNYYLVEALNDNLLDPDTAEAFTAWLRSNQ